MIIHLQSSDFGSIEFHLPSPLADFTIITRANTRREDYSESTMWSAEVF